MLRIKEGFKDERFVSLPDTLLDAYAADPLVGNLYLRKIGYFPRVKYHYVLKQQGCDYAMLLYCTEGEGWYRIDGRRYPLRKNQYAVLPPEVPYELGADNENPWTIYWLHFKGRDCRCYCPDGHAPRDIQPGSESRIQERLNLFEELYQSFSLAYTIDYMRYTSACLHHLLASFLYAEPYDSTRSRTDHGLSFSGQVIRYMEEHIGHRPLARGAGRAFPLLALALFDALPARDGHVAHRLPAEAENPARLSVHRAFGLENQRDCTDARIRRPGLLLASVHPHHGHHAVGLPDERKGERRSPAAGCRPRRECRQGMEPRVGGRHPYGRADRRKLTPAGGAHEARMPRGAAVPHATVRSGAGAAGMRHRPCRRGRRHNARRGEESNIPPPPFTVSHNPPRYLDPGLRRPLPGAPVRSSPSTAR